MADIQKNEIGKKYSKSYKVYFKKNNSIISPIHDIKYKEDSLYMVISEIPRFESAKFEMATKIDYNPIVQDEKKGKLRYYPNLFPMKGSIWNYGAIPQTWEDPNEKDEITGIVGDNDPIDVIEVGNVKKEVGEIYKIKIIGSIGLIDGDETDWKIIGIDSRDPLFEKINNSEDLERIKPGYIKETLKFFINYKHVLGGVKNSFFKNGEVLSAKESEEIVERAHKTWMNMKKPVFKEKPIMESNQSLEKVEENEGENIFYFV